MFEIKLGVKPPAQSEEEEEEEVIPELEEEVRLTAHGGCWRLGPREEIEEASPALTLSHCLAVWV